MVSLKISSTTSGAKDDLENGPKINIPDTVIYKFRQPAYWYFTSSDGTVKKKTKYNLSNVRIEEAIWAESVRFRHRCVLYLHERDARGQARDVH